MMKTLIIFILAASVTLISSCGGKGEQTETKFELSTSAISVAGFEGGIIIYGTHPQSGERFSKVLDGEPIELINGNWNLMFVGWDGIHSTLGSGNLMEGQMKCGTTSVNLEGGDQTVSLAFSTGGCSADVFGASSTKTSNFPKPIKLFGCSNRADVNEDLSNADCRLSLTSSFRIGLPQLLPNGTRKAGLVSRCIEANLGTAELDNSTDPHEIIFPMFLPVIGDPDIVVETFEDTTCNNSIGATRIEHLYANLHSGQPFNLKDDSGFTENEILVAVPTCNAVNGNLTTPFYDGSNYVLCDKDQFAGHMGGFLGSSYILDSDIDFNGDSFGTSIVDGNFTGNLVGNGFVIRNFNVTGDGTNPAGLFRTISGSVEDLTIADSSITCPSGFAGGSGILAGRAEDTGSATISDIFLSNISVDASDCSAVGGMIGLITNGGASGVLLKDIDANLIAIETIDGASEVGGLIGQAGDRTKLRDAHLSNITLDDTSAGIGIDLNFGGVFGKIVGNQSSIRNVIVENARFGSTTYPLIYKNQIGLLVGVVGDATTGGALVNVDSVHVEGRIEAGNDSQSVGGLVGVSHGANYKNILSDIIINVDDGLNIFDSVGGVFGNIDSQGTTGNTVENIRSVGEITCGGERCGGVFGRAAGANTRVITMDQIYSSVNINGIDADSDMHGGIFGFLADGVTANFLQYDGVISVNGGSDIGGIAGRFQISADASYIYDTASFGEINGSGTNIGGIIGNYYGYTITDIQRSIVDMNITATGTSIFNNVGASSGSNDDKLSDCYFLDNNTIGENGDMEAALSGGCVVKTEPDLVNLSVGFGGISAIVNSPPSSWHANDGTVNDRSELTFVNALDKIGGLERLGNFQDPFVITSRRSWNAIEDKPFLMDKAFSLEANISFNDIDGDFTPIGSVTNPFAGIFFPNNNTLSDIRFLDSSSTQPLGIFRVIDKTTNGDIFIHDEDNNENSLSKLFIRDVYFYSDQNHLGVLAGHASDHFVSANNQAAIFISGIDIENATLVHASATATHHVGGLIGSLNVDNDRSEIQQIRIDNLLIDGTSSFSAAVGGVFGSMIEAAAGTYNFKAFQVLNSEIDCGFCTDVGGFTGSLSGADLELENVNIQDVVITGQLQVGGLVGTGNVNSLSGAAVNNITVTATDPNGDAAGAFSNLTFGTVKGLYVNSVSATGITAGNITGRAACGYANLTAGVVLENSYFRCINLTGQTVRYFAYDTGNIDSPNSNDNSLLYVAPTTDGSSEPEIVFINTNDESVLRDEAIFTTYPNFSSLDPWVIEGGDLPRTVMEKFPEFFFY